MFNQLTMNRKLLIFIFIFVFSCIVAWKTYLFDLNDPYIVGDDARSVLFGVLRFSDPNLFPNYFLADYAENVFVTPGVKILYRLSSGFIDAIAFSKILSFLILIVSVLFLFKLMYTITASKVSSTLAILFFVSISNFKGSISGGFPRSFALLLTICFLYFLIKRYWFKVFITLSLAILLHPISFLTCFATFVLSSISINKNSILINGDKKRTIALIASLAIAAFVLVPQNMLNSSPAIGKTMGPAIAKAETAYYEGGRPGNVALPTPNVFEASYQQLISPFALNSKVKILDQKGFSKEKSIITRLLFLFMIVFIFIGTKYGFKIVPKEVACYLLSGMILYLIADAVFIKLYFPDRYIVNFNLVSLIIVFSGLNVFLRFLRSIHLKKFWSYFIIFVVTLAIFLSSDFSSSIGMTNYSYDKPILNYISSLPKETTIAAYPMGTADSIPLLSKRKSFIFYEVSNPLYDQHWKWVKENTMKFFRAYYSEDLRDVEHFMQSNNIDYLLVDKRHFEKNFLSKKQIYFNPFSKQIAKIIQGKESFALQKIPPEYWDFKLREKYIISLKKIQAINNQGH